MARFLGLPALRVLTVRSGLCMGWGRGAGREAVGREDKGGKGLLGDELQTVEGRQGNLLRAIRCAYENLVTRVGA